MTKNSAVNIIDEAGICHHEVGNLLVFNGIIWGVALCLIASFLFIGNVKRVYLVDGVKSAMETTPYYGLPDSWVASFLGNNGKPSHKKNIGEGK